MDTYAPRDARSQTYVKAGNGGLSFAMKWKLSERHKENEREGKRCPYRHDELHGNYACLSAEDAMRQRADGGWIRPRAWISFNVKADLVKRAGIVRVYGGDLTLRLVRARRCDQCAKHAPGHTHRRKREENSRQAGKQPSG
jgi:hypothetical protein